MKDKIRERGIDILRKENSREQEAKALSSCLYIYKKRIS